MKFVFCFIFASILSHNIYAQKTIRDEPFFPQKMTAKMLISTCASSKMSSTGMQRKKYCFGFISGVEETTRLLGKQAINPAICLPAGKTSHQFADVYMAYASRKTTDLNKPAALVVIEAFQEAFPCHNPG